MFSQMTTFTYVTAYLYDADNLPMKHPEFAMEHLRTLSRQLSTSHLVIFVLKTGESAVRELVAPYGHVTIVPLSLDDLWTWRTLGNTNYELPHHRNPQKDTRDHIWRTHACVELAHRSTELFADTTHICWMNFTVPYLFREPDETFAHLRRLAQWQLAPKMLAMPGCETSPMTPPDQQICWRFCGAVFWGDTHSINEFYHTYCRELPPFLEAHQVLPWEVNFWAYLESRGARVLAGAWYAGNHDDSLVLGLPPKYYTQCLRDTTSFCKTTYEYPAIADMRPTSAAFLQLQDGRRVLNTRYVNYWLYPNGSYLYPQSAYRCDNNSYVIENTNLVCDIDDTWMPVEFRHMKENMGLTEHEGAYSRGLEDIRLYEYDGKIKCIATNVNYMSSGRNRMILGNYCLATGEITDGHRLEPPQETWCEKNWIPVQYGGQEAFIYQWWPMQIGVLDKSDKLVIVREHVLTNPLFRRVRGSTLFLPQTGKSSLIGVVHFSEEGSPRKYFHMLVELDGETLMPMSYSQPFCFESLGVEFCIGFAHTQNEYLFWISRMDRDPCMIRVSKEELILSN